MDGELTPWAALEDAYRRPWRVAERWRAAGGAVVGVIGRDLPREIVAAAGLLPIRLSPLRLDRAGADLSGAVPSGLAAQLAPGPVKLLGALLSGALDWVDAIAIGRDSEAHTSLFYVMRELARLGRWEQRPPFVFCDLLRVANRHSARYNRIRFREFAEMIGPWTARPIDDAALVGAIAERAAVAEQLRLLTTRRRSAQPAVTGAQALLAAGAAQVLPTEAALTLLAAAATAPAGPATPGRVRIFVSGSGQDDPWTYRALENAGAQIVGEDHEWADTGEHLAQATSDPWDGLVDHYHLGPHAAARSGLRERTQATADGVRDSGAEAVVQIVFAHDETPPWEVPQLRLALGEEIPVETVALRYGDLDEAALVGAVAAAQEGHAHV
jgi:benzoyl-CoA reductase/2-hydroxyglutaryl-CoA dehydratase subunit BcrC/BadD/HgdB